MFAAYPRKPHLEVLAMPPRPTPPTVVASAAAAAAALAAAEKAERSEKAEKSAGKAIEKPADEKTATDKAAEKSAEKSADKAGAAQPDALILAVTAPKSTFSPGEQVQLAIAPSRDAFVYCYLQDDAGKVQRFYPNRFNRESRVEASKPLTLPGAMRFQLLASEKRVKETIACFATARNVMAELPAAVVGTDFETLSVASLRDVRDAFVKFAGNGVAQGIFHVEPK